MTGAILEKSDAFLMWSSSTWHLFQKKHQQIVCILYEYQALMIM